MFFIAAQIAKVAQSMLFKWARQLGQPGQQQKKAARVTDASVLQSDYSLMLSEAEMLFAATYFGTWPM